ncbi:uncharacterized protein BT62DRAFT_1007065 [Guyanagaster necrorhizus]|uniref:Uncharacterized protein n=1 Tax=Guyanagaster necrorhizus TaxID=856835 RepID=A0A9P7VRF3_9AGAR|nr:uncharacterized protein BT62DRAFT_1007065 [Guyanagaster necrorhizus MCA 3950]KAG7445345.1 hypothetical protein BT62DRAFT_1007065 [Guyanagaster necrorhizus MCA 3950]
MVMLNSPNDAFDEWGVGGREGQAKIRVQGFDMREILLDIHGKIASLDAGSIGGHPDLLLTSIPSDRNREVERSVNSADTAACTLSMSSDNSASSSLHCNWWRNRNIDASLAESVMSAADIICWGSEPEMKGFSSAT